MISLKKIFISYAREDLDAAERLYRDLRQQGFAPWLDEQNLLAGQNWREFIPQEMRNSDYVIMLLSTRSVSKRGFVQVEQKRALEIAEEFPDFDIFVIPARLNDCEIPPRLADINVVDLFSDYETGLDKISRALTAARQSAQPRPSPPPPQSAAPPTIYVSFSVIDNEQQWVSSFVHYLESEIAQRLGTKDGFTIFMDRQAQSEAPEIPAEIIQTIENSAILIAVASPGYLHSARCQRERLTFLRKAQEIIVVERERIDDNKLPDVLKTLRPVRFWSKIDGNRLKILGHPIVKPEQDDTYFEIITAMSFTLADKLQCLPALEQSPPLAECPPITDQSALPPVFLAEVTEDLEKFRDDIQRYLTQAGFRVAPENPPEMTESAILKALEPCRVVVQLLSQFSGKSRKAGTGICRLQFECAKQAGKTILQWRSPDLVLANADEDQQKLLSEPSVMAFDPEEFKQQIVKRAAFKPAESPIAPDVLVFINADREDQTHAQDVSRLLDSRQIGHVLPIWESEETERLQDMENFILNAHGVVIVYGNVHVAWVRKQVLYCKSFNYRRETPLTALGVYDAPVANKQDLNFKLPGVVVINCRNCLNESQFAPFFASLTQGGSR